MMKSLENKQSKNMKQTTYILYMMIASYFKTCKCTSNILEERLFLYYRELTYAKQEIKERQVLDRLEKKMQSVEDLALKESSVVRIFRKSDKKGYVLYFVSKSVRIVVNVQSDARYEIKLYVVKEGEGEMPSPFLAA